MIEALVLAAIVALWFKLERIEALVSPEDRVEVSGFAIEILDDEDEEEFE